MQKLAFGATLTEKYAGLGGYTGTMVAPPDKLRMFVIGLPGEGKSAFAQSNPNAYILNLDESGTTCPNPGAIMWPGIDSETGQPIGDDGKPLVLKWDDILRKVQILRQLAFSDKPRPSTIVIDSLSKAIRMLKPWICENAPKLGVSKDQAKQWNELHGQAAWDQLHNSIGDLLEELHTYGYGVCLIGHVVNSKIPIGDNEYAFKPELTITDNFYKKLYPNFDAVTVISRKLATARIPGGKTVTLHKYYADFEAPQMEGITKSRVMLKGRVELPHGKGWSAFTDAYIEAANTAYRSENASSA